MERALASVGATTKYGQVRVHQAVGGSLDLATAYGKVEAGVPEGTPAWLDLDRRPAGPEPAHALRCPGRLRRAPRIRARTSYGDIVVRRA